MQEPNVETQTLVSCRFSLHGMVQGQGVRPTVARIAQQSHITGSVKNTSSGVQVDAFGASDAMCEFERKLEWQFRVTRSNLQPEYSAPRQFSIQPSVVDGSFCTLVPPDLGVCRFCIGEIRDPGSRRYQYPFTSCAECGPRYSILYAMPYDRCQTSMNAFALCTQCLAEYQNPADRRYHAQTNACPNCGPKYSVVESSGETHFGRDAIPRLVDVLTAGGIAAIKGIGGYQLICDATNDRAVNELRKKKQRPAKPLPIMMLNAHRAGRFADVSAAERNALESQAAPIVLLDQKNAKGLSRHLNPGLREIGIMLPTTPLHWLICDQVDRPLVVTSGNVAGNPLEYENESAIESLSGIADVWFHHNREIVRPVDDSVVRIIRGRPMTIRAGRGLAPLAFPLQSSGDHFAAGAHQKVAIAVSTKKHIVLGPHIGNMDGERCRVRLMEQIVSMGRLYDCKLKHFARDCHPDYFTSRISKEDNSELVQHHHAHIAAAMFEHDLLDQTVLGFSFDGIGYGSRDCIWGGEIMVADRCDFRRTAHLRPFKLFGGDLAARQPWRLALTIMAESCPCQIDSCWVPSGQTPPSLLRMSVNSITTTSMGRLFDAVAAIVLGVTHCRYEGEAAMNLEAVCDLSEKSAYSFDWRADEADGDGEPAILDWVKLIQSIVKDRESISAARIAMKFHRAVANLIIDFANFYKPMPAVITGGVFQNRVLLQCIEEQIENQDLDLRFPSLIPINDGGISIGQLVVAHSRRQQSEVEKCV